MARILALRSVLRLAWRDMCRHHARTMFSTLLIALPMMALIVGATLMTGAPPMRERALRMHTGRRSSRDYRNRGKARRESVRTTP